MMLEQEQLDLLLAQYTYSFPSAVGPQTDASHAGRWRKRHATNCRTGPALGTKRDWFYEPCSHRKGAAPWQL